MIFFLLKLRNAWHLHLTLNNNNKKNYDATTAPLKTYKREILPKK